VCRCTARNFGQIPQKFTDLERFKARFPAIFRNFAGQIAHIPQGLSSEQFCVSRVRCETCVRSFPGDITNARRDESCMLTQA